MVCAVEKSRVFHILQRSRIDRKEDLGFHVCKYSFARRVSPVWNTLSHDVSSFMYKYNANMLPINFINYFTKNSAIHVHNTRSANNFH